ncbi:MAG: hypothetical protein K9M00_02385 [Candidatus Omnitrophica bacterium]|nr:hypothetical protein [Candidatus Omnitrophota bacterium]
MKNFKFPLCLLLAMFLLCLSFISYSQENYDTENFTKNIMEAAKAGRMGRLNARFTCPRYLLRYSMTLYNVGSRENAIEIATVAKTIASLVKKALAVNYISDLEAKTFAKEINDPKIKSKMIDYTTALKNAAAAHIKYFKTGDKDIIYTIDEYLDKAFQYDSDLEKILKKPIITNAARIMFNAVYYCPRWLTTLAESYMDYAIEGEYASRGYRKDFVLCPDCIKLTKCAKDINDVWSENLKRTSDKDIDPNYKKVCLEYTDTFKKYSGCQMEFLKLGEKIMKSPLKKEIPTEITSKVNKDLCPNLNKDYQKKLFPLMEKINNFVYKKE